MGRIERTKLDRIGSGRKDQVRSRALGHQQQSDCGCEDAANMEGIPSVHGTPLALSSERAVNPARSQPPALPIRGPTILKASTRQ